MDEMLLENLRCLVHDVFAHDDEQLSPLVRGHLAKPEVVLDDLDNGAHLLWVVLELD
jgi:hypothetical protein